MFSKERHIKYDCRVGFGVEVFDNFIGHATEAGGVPVAEIIDGVIKYIAGYHAGER
jgi:hypothetical protein